MAVTKPTRMPRIAAQMTTIYASYRYMRKPSALVSPIDLRTPYSQLASFTFYVMLINRRKKAKKSEIVAIIATNKLKICVTELKFSTISCLTKTKLSTPVR